MKQYRWLAALAVGAFLMAACGGLQSATPETLVAQAEAWAGWDSRDWNQQNGVDSERCSYVGQTGRPETGWMHWVFTGRGDATEAKLVLGGSGSGAYDNADSPANVFHFYTPYFDILDADGEVTLEATVYLNGTPARNGRLVLSDYCPGTGGRSLEVTKTAETRFEREHLWRIEKGVAPDEFLLYADGITGAGDVTWTVDVFYDGFVDSNFEVFGTIKVENVGTTDKTIESLTDELQVYEENGDGALLGEPIPVDVDLSDCTINGQPAGDSPTLSPGDTLVCKYSYTFDGYSPPGEGYGVNVATVTVDGEEPYEGIADWEFDLESADLVIFGAVDVFDVNEYLALIDGDVSVGEGEWLGTVEAPAFGVFVSDDPIVTFTDSETVSIDVGGFDPCMAYAFDNTAVLTGMKDEETITIDDATATFVVRTECVEFEGETAWAANGDDPLELPYGGGNWATYVEYDEYDEKTVTLFAGRTMEAGSVTFSAVDDGVVTITVNLAQHWEFDDVLENLKVQDYTVAPSGNPEVGHFDHKKDCDAEAAECAIVVPANAFYGVHVNVGRMVGTGEFGEFDAED